MQILDLIFETKPEPETIAENFDNVKNNIVSSLSTELIIVAAVVLIVVAISIIILVNHKKNIQEA